MDKENLSSPSKHDNDISLYGGSSPSNTKCSMVCSPCPKIRSPLAEFDLNSQDSGYGTSFTDKENTFNFTHTGTTADGEETIRISPKRKCVNNLFTGFTSFESMDDGFLELPWKSEMSNNFELPCNFSSLLSGNIKNVSLLSHNTQQKPVFRRSVSLKDNVPSSSRVRSCLFESPARELLESRPFKRPEPPSESISPINSKRCKGMGTKTNPQRERPKFTRSISASEESIMSAVNRCKY